jgi:hypothetical protein
MTAHRRLLSDVYRRVVYVRVSTFVFAANPHGALVSSPRGWHYLEVP